MMTGAVVVVLGVFFLHFSTIAWNTFIKKKVKFITKRKVLRNKDKIHDALSYTIIVNCGHTQDRLLPKASKHLVLQ